VVIGLSAVVILIELIRPAYVVHPAARGAIEMTIAFAALVSAGLIQAHFVHSRRLCELLLLGALATVSLSDFVFIGLPILSGLHPVRLDHSVAAQLTSQVLVASAFLAAALVPRTKLVRHARRSVVVAVGAAVGSVALVGLVAAFTAAHPPGGIGIEAAYDHPVALVGALGCAAGLLIAAVFFGRRANDEAECGLLSAAAVALAAVRLQHLAFPAVGLGWVIPGDGLRVMAYALLLVVAFGQLAYARRATANAAMRVERERIARDLHDGIAQDLAFIAAHGQKFQAELGPDHPMSVAARRALATIREAIVDLCASEAPTTEAALRQIAAELEARFDVEVEVQVACRQAELDGRDREDVTRITREAIVNAIRHGHARRISVILESNHGDLRLRVLDDGNGLPASPQTEYGYGFGMPSMRARAASLGGALVTRRLATGGTELELYVP
jgi:signal transduction histidine kinase